MTHRDEAPTPDVVLIRRCALPVVTALALLLAGCPGRDAPRQPNAPPKVRHVCADPRHPTCSDGQGTAPRAAGVIRRLDPLGMRRLS